MNIKDFIRTGTLHSEKWIPISYWSGEHDLRILQYSKESDEYSVAKGMENDIDGRKIRGRGSETRNNTFTFLVDSEEDPEESNPVIQILHLK
ncbi:MAG: hypothetical protein LUE93_07125 [Bacteroides sp.]|nr:hypothetical protein [Bacteroides sp.]